MGEQGRWCLPALWGKRDGVRMCVYMAVAGRALRKGRTPSTLYVLKGAAGHARVVVASGDVAGFDARHMHASAPHVGIPFAPCFVAPRHVTSGHGMVRM